MSHAHGKVLADEEGQVLGHFEYNGTADVACTRIAVSEDDMQRTWRSKDNMAVCTCGQPPSRVYLFTNYGSGFGWWSRACLQCRAITGPRNRFDAEDEEEAAR